MKAIILYDSRTAGGSTDKFVDMVGRKLAEKGAYVEKAKCKSTGDYSFVKDFDAVIIGAPIYYLLVSSQLLGALVQSNLKEALQGKKIGLFLACGSPEPMANLLYLPQLKINLNGTNILTERVLAPQQLLDENIIGKFVDDFWNAWQ
ncbi:MAG: protochlorophyllide oxidoreductase [Chlorobiaceae bacterium]|nr:protochlorophyllide oxidoreductase [Chlorobiaceae bacterium]NTW10525.1 protochlorophyllide oxidoreductase [Chlorobiaceae bacterium]